MRVTNAILMRSTLADVNRRRAELMRIQEQAASGLRINRPSDDPVGVRATTVLRSQIESTIQLARNQEQARVRLSATETALDQGLGVLARARELAIAGSTDTLDDTAREALAAEVEQMIREMRTVSNSRTSGGYVFGGFASDTEPFALASDFDPTVSPALPAVVDFVGDPNEVEVQIDDSVRLSVTLDGRRVFKGDADGDLVPDGGRVDVFEVLGNLWVALKEDDAVATQSTIDDLEQAQIQLSLERTRIGAATNRLDSASATVGEREFNSRRRLSEVEDADTVAVLSELVNQETALQASLEAMARVLQPSLMDFLG